MGTCYYLFRPDNRTGYELGKAYGWGGAFGDAEEYGRGVPMTLRPEDTQTFAELLEIDLLSHHWWRPEDVIPGYLSFVAADIAAWSEGQPFLFCSEDAGCIEDAWDREADDDTDAWITGSRFDSWERRAVAPIVAAGEES